jgi:hypothetical protein
LVDVPESMETNRLESGLTGTLTFSIRENKTVPFLYPEAPKFRTMPAVFAPDTSLDWSNGRA